jgi:hypothetical protein
MAAIACAGIACGRWRAKFQAILYPESPIAVIARSEATKQSSLAARLSGLLRGACHRARIRATRWLAMMCELFVVRLNRPSYT